MQEVKTILNVKAKASLDEEIKEELKLKDPEKQAAKASLDEHIQSS